MSETLRVWTRADLEAVEEADRPEGHPQYMFRVRISPKLLLLLMNFQEWATGERAELVAIGGQDTMDVDMKFYKRDSVNEDFKTYHLKAPYPGCVAQEDGCPFHPYAL